MSTWNFEPSVWEGEDFLTVSGHGGAVRAAVALRGATPLSRQLRRNGELGELTDGYRDPALPLRRRVRPIR